MIFMTLSLSFPILCDFKNVVVIKKAVRKVSISIYIIRKKEVEAIRQMLNCTLNQIYVYISWLVEEHFLKSR